MTILLYNLYLQIGIKQGLEMLKIFKNFTSKTSLLDDFIFYENREKSLRVKRGNKPATLKMELSVSSFALNSIALFAL